MGIETALLAAGIGAAGSLGAAAIGSSGGSSGQVQQASTLTPAAKKFYDQIIALASPGVGQPLPTYPGEQVAAQDPLQKLLSQFYTGAAPGAMGLSDIVGQASQGYDPNMAWNYLQQAQDPMAKMLANFDPASTQKTWETSVRDPGMLAWRDIQNQITESNIQRGRGSGGYLDTALSKAGGDLATQMTGQLGQLMYSGEQSQLGRQQAGINQLMNLIGMPGQIMGQAAGVQGIGSDILGAAGQAGATNQAYQQQLINAEMQKWKEQLGPNWMDLAPLILGTQASENYYQQPSAGIGSVLSGGLGQLFGSQGFQNLLMPQTQYGGTTSQAAAYNPGGFGGMYGGGGTYGYSPSAFGGGQKLSFY